MVGSHFGLKVRAGDFVENASVLRIQCHGWRTGPEDEPVTTVTVTLKFQNGQARANPTHAKSCQANPSYVPTSFTPNPSICSSVGCSSCTCTLVTRWIGALPSTTNFWCDFAFLVFPHRHTVSGTAKRSPPAE